MDKLIDARDVSLQNLLSSDGQIQTSGIEMKPMNPAYLAKLSPERVRIAKVFTTHIEKAIEELGVGYDVTLQGRFDKTPIRIEIEVNSKEGIP
jgi:hypothetical protein